MIKYLCCAGLLAAGVVFANKTYPVAHTVSEWQYNVAGLAEVQRIIHNSEVPAKDAFLCDSILQSQIMDISRQVNAAMIADTTNKSKKP